MTTVLFDLQGQVQNWPSSDRAWQFGDGVFRTVYAEDGQVRDLVGQVAHLLHDAQLLELQPLPSVAQLCETSQKVIGKLGKYRLKWVISGGDSAGGYLRAGAARTMLALAPLPDEYAPPNAIDAWVCCTRLQQGGSWASAKHLNRLEQVMARRERDPHQFAEGVLCDVSGRLGSGISSNFFWVDSAQQLFTHPLDGAGVHGRTRNRILALADRQTAPVVQKAVDFATFSAQAVEAFVCNSLWGCVSVKSLETWSSAQNTQCAHYRQALGFH